MTAIHPTARLGRGVAADPSAAIGPWCELTGSVAIESEAQLLQHTVIAGNVKIEPGVRIYPGARIGTEITSESDPAANNPPTIIIERNAVIRELAVIEPGTADAPTRIGQDAYIMARTHIGPSVTVGRTATIANAVQLGPGSHVAENVTIGGNTLVGTGVRIGRMAMLSGTITVSRDIPPFCTAYLNESVGSLNLVGLRRAGLRQHIDGLRRSFQLLYRSNLSPEQAAQQIAADPALAANPLCEELTNFINQSNLGIAPYIGAENPTNPTNPTTPTDSANPSSSA